MVTKRKISNAQTRNETVVIYHAASKFINLAKNKMLNKECDVG
jgi:hypothetical protein